jgi:hypothetical protein
MDRLTLGHAPRFSKLVFAFCMSVAVTLIAPHAHADLLLEPYIGYGIGNLKADYNGGGSLKYTVNGVNIGGRVAIALPIVYFGLDGQYGTGSAGLSSDSAGAFHSTNFTRTALFAFVGAHIPMLRAWAGYGFLNNLKFASASTSPETTFKGSAIKLGAAFTGLPVVDLNLEYIMSTYNKTTVAGSTVDVGSSGLFSTATDSTILLSVSAPFDF